MNPGDEIERELFPFLRIYKSNRVERLLGTDVVPPSPAAGNDGVASKDVAVGPVAARLYLPRRKDGSKLPLLVFVHGGGFVTESAASPTYHNYLTRLAAASEALIVSVEYRRAPEHPLPVAYDDSWTVLQWSLSLDDTDEWIRDHADLSRVFLAGDSAGGTIAHYMLSKTRREGRNRSFAGAAILHPWFVWSGAPEDEMTLWKFVCPGSGCVDDDRANPGMDEELLGDLPCQKLLVCVGEKDELRQRGEKYFQAVKRCGFKGEVEWLESKGANHVFFLWDDRGEQAKEMMEKMVAFLNT